MFSTLSLYAVLCVAFGSMCHGQTLEGQEWSVASKFKDKKAKRNLSGAACADDRAEKAWCLVVNDETGFAQFFSIADRELVPTGPIRLLQPAVGEDRAEIDAEAVA